MSSPAPQCSSRLASNFNNSGNAQNPIMSSPSSLSVSFPSSLSLTFFRRTHVCRSFAYAAYIRKSSRDRPLHPLLKFRPRMLATPCPDRSCRRLPIGGAPGNLIFRNDDANSSSTRRLRPLPVPGCPVGIFLSPSPSRYTRGESIMNTRRREPGDVRNQRRKVL